MKTGKILAFFTAAAIGSCSVFSVSADEQADFKASVGLASGDMSVQNWNSHLDINEGENTVVFTPPKDKKGSLITVDSIGLLVIDLEDCYFDIGKVEVNSIKIDGEPVDFEEDAIVYGADDGADNDNFRIELYNDFGVTKDYPPFDYSSVNVTDSVEVVFTVSRDGYSGGKKNISGNTVKKSSNNSPLSGCTITAENTDGEGDAVTVEASSDKFSLELDRGIYDVTFSKKGYVTKTVQGVRAGKSAAPSSIQNVELCSLGDVNGDGKLNAMDITKIAAHIKALKRITDDEQLAAADCNIDEKINVVDITTVAAAIKGIKKIN